MPIQRTDLIHAIANAQKTNETEIYNELLRIYYLLLRQEEIKDKYMKEFTFYQKISQRAIELLSV